MISIKGKTIFIEIEAVLLEYFLQCRAKKPIRRCIPKICTDIIKKMKISF